ncbi:MAG: hypothetical protein IPL32_16110 [Chloracidobacterium sp.]|nr:hypothetical protein [Chloracidobacterium sp.]
MDILLSAIDQEFISLDSRSRELLTKLTDDRLFTKPREIAGSMTMFSCGEYILRSAAMVEKTFGGITTRLWDDPFEWTLPEKLADRTSILQYLDEVHATRMKGMAFFFSDQDLTREIPAPERLRPLIDILLDTLMSASHFQGRAFAVFQMISDQKLPRL